MIKKHVFKIKKVIKKYPFKIEGRNKKMSIDI